MASVRYERIEKVASGIGTACLVALTALLILAAIPNLLFAWEVYQRGTPEARYMSFGWWLAAGILLTYALLVGALAVGVRMSDTDRPTALLLAGVITSLIGVAAFGAAFSGEFAVALRASVPAGLCALLASVVLNWLRFRNHVRVPPAEREQDWPDLGG
jgi:hypothetical protein